MQRLQRRTLFPLGQLVTPGVKQFTDGIAVLFEQRGWIVTQVVNDDAVAVGGVLYQRQDRRNGTELGRIHAAGMQNDLVILQIDLLLHVALQAEIEVVVEKPRLFVPDKPGDGNRRMHVGQGIMGILVGDTVGPGELFEPETGNAGLGIPFRPVDALGTQGMRQSQQVENIPATVTVLPLARIGVEEVAVEPETGDLVIETDTVVTHTTGSGCCKLLVNGGKKVGLAHSPLLDIARCHARHERRHRMRKVVSRRLAVEHDRLVDNVEFEIGPDPCELRRAIVARIDAPGFVVVPEQAFGRHDIVWQANKVR